MRLFEVLALQWLSLPQLSGLVLGIGTGMLSGEDVSARGRLAVLRLDKSAQSFEDALYVSGGADGDLCIWRSSDWECLLRMKVSERALSTTL